MIVRRWPYYEEMKALARTVRARYGLNGPRVTRSDLRRVYKVQRITVHLWPYPLKKLRGAYFNDECGVSVMIDKSLPEDPRVFTMAHELKHHFVDADRAAVFCGLSNRNEIIEIGAEVFAAEFLFPDQLFVANMMEMRVPKGICQPESLVRLKRETKTTLSYSGLVKKAEFLGFASPGSLDGVRWKKLEEKLYGVPFYKQKHRLRRATRTRAS